MTGEEAETLARSLFLDDRHNFGCAETVFIVLKHAFELPDPDDPSAAMAFNGGVAYSGGICGVIAGSAVAVGLLAARKIPDHVGAKRTTQEIIGQLMTDFREEFGAVDCRTLIGRDIRTPEQHRAFLDSGVWRDVCMRQIVFAVRRLAELPDAAVWSSGACLIRT